MPHAALIEARLKFLEIGPKDTEELRNAKRILEPALEQMLSEFYAHISSEPELVRIFADDKSLERAREAQRKHWLQTLFGGRFGSVYFDKAEQIGRSHARVGLTPNWYIGGYCKMLVQFIRHISTTAKTEGYDASPMIEALCKAVLLDLDVVIHCYLEAKNKSMLDILERVTSYTDDMSELNSQLNIAAARVRESAEALTIEGAEDQGSVESASTLIAAVETLNEKVKQIDDRMSQLKTGDRLYVHSSRDRTGIFAQLKSMLLGE